MQFDQRTFILLLMEYDVRRDNYTFKRSRSSEIPGDQSLRFTEHYHSLYELLYFIGGRADYKINNRLYTLRPHNLLVAKPGEPHHVIIKSRKKPYERIVIRFDEADLPYGFRHKIRALSDVYDVKGSPLSEEIFRMDKHALLADDDARFFAMRWQLNVILTYLCESDDLRQHADVIDENVRRITDYIERHLTEIYTIEDLCTGLHMSRSNLNRLFSRSFDMPVMSYVRTQKVTLAHAMLNDGFLPTEMPAKCGFNNYSTFYRSYQRIYETSPSAVGK